MNSLFYLSTPLQLSYTAYFTMGTNEYHTLDVIYAVVEVMVAYDPMIIDTQDYFTNR